MARSYNGTTDNIRADSAHVAAAGTAFSIAFWVKGSTQTASHYMYSEGNTATLNTIFGIETVLSSNKVTAFLRNDANSNLVNSNTTANVIDGTWHHVIYTQDSSNNWQVYVDGIADISGSYATSTVTTNLECFGALKRTSSATSNFFGGTIGSVASWTRLLSAGDAISLASDVSPLLLGAAHYWPMYGVDSPEPDLGIATHVTGTVSGTAFAQGRDPASLLDLVGATTGVA